MNLNETQLNFFLEKFFKNEKYPGWKNIATELIQKGTCLVAGDGLLWRGGVGNFIKVSKAENAVGCSQLTFDIEEFMSDDNKFFMEHLIPELKEVTKEMIQSKKRFRELCDLHKIEDVNQLYL